MSDINWGYNCFTGDVHHGRPESLWKLPLLQAALQMFGADELKELVIARIHNDAMQFVTASPFIQKGTGATTRFTQEWADKVKECAEAKYRNVLQQKIGEISNYYNSPTWKNDQKDVVERLKANKLNSHYEPLHDHDSLNLLCRILAVSADIQVSRQRIEQTQPRTKITEETTIWFPGHYVGRTDKTYTQIASHLNFDELVELVKTRAQEDGEWAITNGFVGDNEDKMRRMMAFVSDEKNIRQCVSHIHAKGLDHKRTVDWICRDLAKASKAVIQ